jgi:intracellular multiplication protein IcmD
MKKVTKLVVIIGMLFLGFCTTYVLAATNATLGTIASNVSGTLENVIKLITAGAYMAGFALTVGALFKFKQHKDNPQQTQLGTAIAMLLVGVSLVFLPSILSTGGETIFGGTKTPATSNGFTNVISGK